MLEKLLEGALKRRRDLEEAVFRSPPATMEEFHQRLGRWLELSETVNWVQHLLDQLDKDE